MATTNDSTSASLRRQIGLAAARLQRALTSAKTNCPNITDKEAADELEDKYDEVTQIHSSILKPFTKLQNLHQQWIKLMDNNEKEQAVFADFLTRKGDYTTLLTEAVDFLETLDNRLHILEQSADELNIALVISPTNSIIADAERTSSPSSNVHSVFMRTPQPKLAAPPAHEPPRMPPDPTTPQGLQFTAPPGLPGLPVLQATQGFHTSLGPTGFTAPIPPGPTAPMPTAYASLGSTTPSGFIPQGLLPSNNPLETALLTRLDVPTFNGSLTDFPEFWTRFFSLVDSKATIDAGSKFSLLKSCLTGPALDCIQGIPVTGTNYPLAIQLLHSTYNDPSTIRHLLYSKLLNLPSCDERNLSQRFSQMNSLVRQFTTLDPNASKEFGLAASLLNKLPRSIRGRILDKVPANTNVTPIQLMEILGGIVRREFIIDSMTNRQAAEHDAYFNANSHKRAPHKGTSTSSRPVHKNPERTPQISHLCNFCNGNHKPLDCSTHPTIEKRIEIIKEKRLCFNCLSSEHTTRFCTTRFNCRFCDRRHHSSICKVNGQGSQPPSHTKETRRYPPPRTTTSHAQMQAQRPPPAPQLPKERAPPTRRHQEATHMATDVSEPPAPPPIAAIPEYVLAADLINTTEETTEPQQHSQPVALMCVTVTLSNPAQPDLQIRTTAFFDSGSTRTYISRELAQSLQLQNLKDEDLTINVFGQQRSTFEAQLHQLSLHLPDSTIFNMHVRSLPLLAQDVPYAQLPSTAKDEANIPSIAVERTSPGILIGADHFWELLLWDRFSTKQLPGGLRLLETRVGSIVSGPTLTMESVYCNANEYPNNPLSKAALDTLVERFWSFETAGLEEPSPEDADAICLDHFQKHIRFDDEEQRYYVKWPFRLPTTDLPTNEKLAYSRLWNNWKTLAKNPDNLQKYNSIITEQLSRHIIEEAPPTTGTTGTIHYLAHHAVVTENKRTTKVRMVFDASAKEKGHHSLNDTLYRGPVLLPDICGILLRCRFAPILLSADIEKAFLMIGLEETDRDFTRFLWLKDPAKPPSPSNLITYRFRRVPFGIISSPFMLAGTIHFHLSNDDSELSQKLLENLYVDNSFISVKSIEEAKEIYHKAKKLFHAGNMNLREWISNNPTLNNFFETEEKATMEPNAKVLGVTWETGSDTFLFTLQQPDPQQQKWTKRQVLKHTASTFDPLGLLAPVIFRYKLFLQTLWQDNRTWDQLLSEDQEFAWRTLLHEDQLEMTSVEQPRLLSHIGPASKLQLHVFCDASKDGMGACAYLRVENSQGVSTHLLMAKTRISPIKKKITIPRLELSALTSASALAKYLIKELHLPIQDVFLWTDSTAALGWFHSKAQLPIFVENRVRQIQKNTPDAQIRHVRSEKNPADVASRGCNFSDLKRNDLWWNGPSFLREQSKNWPPLTPQKMAEEHSIEDTLQHHSSDSDEQSGKQEDTFVSTHQVNKNQVIIDADRFSSWNRLISTMMFILTFLKLKLGPRFNRILIGPWHNRSNATFQVFRLAQQEYPPSSTTIKQLNLQRNIHGLYTMVTRINSLQSLVYLPPESRFSMLYILHIHESLLHAGTSYTLNHIRRHFWIPKGRSLIRKIIRNHCYKCKRQIAKPFALPPFPTLPETRTTKPPYPFYNSGLDYLGPYSVTENRKAYICLFTCLSTRAIYAEVAHDLSAHTFVNILRRFIATQGCPRTIIADNALHFTTTSSAYMQLILKDSKDMPEFHDLCVHHRMEFKFIPAFSPWSGGIYERMVGLLKNALGHALGRTPPVIDDFRTLVYEATAIVNMRPLTYVPAEPNEQHIICLRPVDFIRPSVNIAAPLFETETEEEWTAHNSKQTDLLTYWHHTTEQLDRFWKRWQTEYLQELRNRLQRNHKQGHHLTHRLPLVGEIVLVHHEHIDRGKWKMGKILRLTNDVIRSADIQMTNGRTITRPISLIYPLEVTDVPKTAKLETKDLDQKKEDRGTKERTNIHPMTTRSKTRQHLLFATILSLLCLMTPSSALETSRCSKTMENQRIIYAENCQERSVAIATYANKNGNTGLCWKPVECPVGQIRFQHPVERTPNVRICGERCHCPSAVSCSFYEGPRAQESRKDRIPDNIAEYQPPYVCSFEKTSLCESDSQMTTLPFIQLFDGTTFIVEALQIHQPDADTTDPPLCFNRGGSPVPFEKSTPSDGTSGFCTIHKCVENYQLFCTIRTAAAIFSFDNFTIPVKQWGHTLRSFYSFKETPDDSTVTPPIAVCEKGGILLMNAQLSFVEACVNLFCIRQAEYKDGSLLLFPTSIVIFEYTVNVKLWNHGMMISSITKTCPSHPICETIGCTLCQEHLWNYQCWTLRDALLIAAAWITFATIYILLSPFMLLFRLLRLFIIPLRWLWKKSCSCRKRRNQFSHNGIPTMPIYTRRSRRRPIFKTMALFMICMQPISACSDTITISGTSTNCIANGDKETCSIDSTNTVVLQPLSQEVCFVLRDQQGHPAAVLTLRISSVQHKCNKRILFYTRDHKFYSESSHRCYRAGSCQSKRCETTKINDRLAEFTDDANDSPGFTYCTASCGCVSCDGCFFCDPSCLFFRYYAWPSSKTVYAIFDCPSYSTEVTGTATIEREGHSADHVYFELDPAKPFRWNSISFTLASHSAPPLPVLSSTFIDNGQITALLPHIASEFGLNSPGQLKCLSPEDASSFKCTFVSEVCNCVPSAYSVSCQCTNGDINKYMTKSPLPIHSSPVTLIRENGRLVAKSSQGTAVQVILSTSGLQWTTRIHKNSCQLKILSQIEGCYSCLPGARMRITCHSSPSEEIAEVICGETRSLVKCTPKEEPQELRLNLDESHIDMQCHLKCRFSEDQVFQVQGKLAYVTDVMDPGNTAVVATKMNHYEDPLKLLSNVINTATTAFLRPIGIVLAIIVFIIFVIICFKLYLYFYPTRKAQKLLTFLPPSVGAKHTD